MNQLLVFMIGINIASSESFNCSSESDCPEDVYCSSGSDCFVHCSGISSCSRLNIYVQNSTNLHLKCSNDKSCYYVDINVEENTDNVDIYCTSYKSCYGADIYAQNTNNVYLECSDKASCRSLDLYGPNDGNLNINCNYTNDTDHGIYETCASIGIYAGSNTANFDIYCGDRDCQWSDFYLSDTINANFIFDALDAGSRVNIYGQNVTNMLNITCKGKESCDNLDLYCPFDADCNIDCVGFESCTNMDIYIESRNYDMMNVSCNPNNNNTCFDNTAFSCLDDVRVSSKIFYNKSHDVISCYPACCPLSIEEISCGSGECNIDCGVTECEGRLINATANDEFSISCPEDIDGSSCDGLAVYCPMNGDCNILCDPVNDDFVNGWSCNDMVIWADNNSNVDITCNDYWTCWRLTLISSNANSVSINGYGSYSYFFSKIYAENVTDFNLVCDSTDYGDNACVWMDLYLSAYNNVFLTCIGRGCEYFEFYGPNYTMANVQVSLESACQCDDEHIYDCTGTWRFECDEGLDSYERDGCQYGNCGCKSFMDDVKDNYIDSCISTTTTTSTSTIYKATTNTTSTTSTSTTTTQIPNASIVVRSSPNLALQIVVYVVFFFL